MKTYDVIFYGCHLGRHLGSCSVFLRRGFCVINTPLTCEPRASNSKKLKLIFEFNFIHKHIFSKVVYAFHVTSSMNQGYFLLFGLLGRTKMTHHLYIWNEYIFSLDSTSENPRRNTTLEILFSNYDKDVRPNQGGNYIRFVHQDYRRLNVLLKSFYMFPGNIITTQNILLVAY